MNKEYIVRIKQDKPSLLHCFNTAVISGCLMVDPVHVGLVQSSVAHALYRIWPFPATEHDRHVAHNLEHAQWCYLLRAFPWTYNDDNSII